jgi:biotin-dependent carboxylase-like uncharacterized protein
MIKVLKAGFYSTIQDQGRLGYRSFGVPVSGAMDKYSSVFANKILGNYKEAAVLEMTMIGAELKFLVPTVIAIVGANMNAKLNGKSILMFTAIIVKTDDVLSLSNVENGFRTYVAVKGGFLTEMILGSRSMFKDITESIKVKTGDCLVISKFEILDNIKNAKVRFDNLYLKSNSLEVTKGPEFNNLSKEQQEKLLSQNFEVSKYNNRMAYQLLPLFQNNLEPILTAPVLPGTVQLTPSGQLIVLMRDCQTTGGYPRVLQLTQQAINSLGQKKTGTNVLMRLRI